jgi:2-oxoisovalerate dehydrogenase E1 component alpha subunit
MTIKINTISYLDEHGNLKENCHSSISDEILVKGLKVMLFTRLIDEKMITLQRQGTITFAMSSLGEECCAVGTGAALESTDWVYPQYREAGIMFWRGFTAQEYIHHMFGDAEDLILGRQMPNHFGSRKKNVVTVSSPIGTKIPHAAGCAYAMKVQKEKSVVVCFFGEGATSEGDFHAGLNFASVLKCPVIFFCRNNSYAISTPCSRQFASDGIAPKGIGYGIETFRIDGNDFFAVYDTVKKARSLCLENKGPILIEAMTYRLGAHSTSDDPTVYRKADEAGPWEKKDPVIRLRAYLEKRNLWNQRKEEDFKKDILNEITKAVDTAKITGKPSLDSIVKDVYFETPESLKEQLAQLKTFFPEG